MLKNYFKIAVRNIKRFKIYSLINIFGLAVGITCSILIFLFIQDELSYDRYHEKAERIFRLVDSFDSDSGFSRDFALSSAPFAPVLMNEFPEVENAVRFFLGRRRLVNYGEKKFYEDSIIFADASVFNIFTLPMIKGNKDNALADPNSVVLSEEIAQKYFGSEEAINKTIKINDQDYLITGIMKKMPKNSHFYADIFASLKTLEQNPTIQEHYFKSWARHEFYTYLLLKEGVSYQDLQAKLPALIEKHASQQIKTLLGSSLSSYLQPLKSIYLHSHLQYEISPTGDIKYVYIFSLIALFILLIACINFMNLATARSSSRSREVGLRKVIGANRQQLMTQFLGESIIFTFIALIMAVIIAKFTLPLFNSFTGKSISFHFFQNIVLLAVFLIIIIFVGLTSGSYPAVFISNIQPANVLKSQADVSSKRSLMRKGLVVFQFCVSIILIISTLVVFNQLDFVRNKKLGFNKENVVLIPIRSNSMRLNSEAIKSNLTQHPNITHACISIGVPGGVIAGDAINLITEEWNKRITVKMIYTDHDFIKTMGMEIIQGRDFSKDMSTDANEAIIINEAAVRQFQLQHPLKTQFIWGDGEKKGKVIGVVKDFQFQSLKDEITPLIIQVNPSSTFTFAVRIRPDNIRDTLSHIENKWKELDKTHPFEFSFMDESFDKLYKNEEKLGHIFSIFSLLAIFIACLGLFGLSLFMVEQRTKEIGIRKILGASFGKIFILLSKEFFFLIFLANLIAWPAAYLLMHSWLEEFAYRIPIHPWVFFLSAFSALVISMFTIGFHAVKAAATDPVDSLRYE